MEAEAVETIEGRHGLKAHIYPDWETRNPREDYDHLGTLAQREIGDEASGAVYADENLEETIRELRLDGCTVYPVRYSDYGSSGGRIHGADADDANGYFYVTRAELAEEYGAADRKARRQARAVLEGECEELDAVLQGNVYGYAVEDSEGATVDSCWGFVEIEEPAEWYVLEQAREALEGAEEDADEEERRRREAAARDIATV